MDKQKMLLGLMAFLIISATPSAAQDSDENYRTGMLMDDEAYAELPEQATQLTRGYTALPQSHSLRQYCPTPKNQGDYGTCTSWAAAYAARTIAEAIKNGWTDRATIDREAFSPPFVYKQIKETGDYNCQQGSYPGDALQVMKAKGVPKYSEFHPMCTDNIPAYIFSSAFNHRIDNYFRLFSSTADAQVKISKTKMALSEDCPVVIGMKCYQSFNSAKDLWNGVHDTYLGGHALCVVGYDDNKYGGAFLIMNSWGTTWGNGGFTWVKYSDYATDTKYAFQLYVAKSAPKPEPKPEPKPQPKPQPQGNIAFTWLGDTTVSSPKYALQVLIDAPSQITGTSVTVNGNKLRGIVPVDNDGHKHSVNMDILLSPGRNTIVVSATAGSQTSSATRVVTYNAVKQNTLSGDFYVQLATGEKMAMRLQATATIPTYKVDGSYLSGTRYRVYISNHEPAYVYVIASDLTNVANKVFPPADNISPALVYHDNHIALPDEKWYMQMDNTVGTDYLCVLYSKEPVDIGQTLSLINAGQGSFAERLQSALGSRLVPKADITLSPSAASFNAKTDKTIVPIILEISHK